MDRRSVILGSGTALTIAIAGCMGGDDDGDDDPEDVQTGGGNGDDDNGHDDNGDNGDNGDDLPGIDRDDLDALAEYISIRSIKIDGKTLVISADVHRDHKKEAMVEMGHGLKTGIKDLEALRARIDWIEVRLYDGGDRVADGRVNVDWLEELVEGRIDPEVLADLLEEHFDYHDDKDHKDDKDKKDEKDDKDHKDDKDNNDDNHNG
ncbi:hypothetical protein [Halovivax gelatinilyticus]|uniref:hypothetical protein n=1 Tax=Halovivax gelatinilyticus TaxID=2961597 RepID=UPI0020CA96DB|nr:hypothetical protein [Halovivax gelatinilyticus]